MKLSKNPLVYLIQKTWKYSDGNRGHVVLFWILFIFSGCLSYFGNPWIWAKTLSIIQTEGITKENISTLVWLMLATIPMTAAFWAMHGPARVIETCNAFHVRLNYRKEMLRGVFGLPMSWHAENHSGTTIDKIDKGANAHFIFSGETFEIIYSIVKLIGSFIVLVWIFPLSAIVVLGMMAVCMAIIMRIDKVLIELYKQNNRAENSVVQYIFDAISNISTIITLRVESNVFGSIIKKAAEIFPVFKRSNKLNDVKWWLTAMCCAFMMAIVMTMYLYQQLSMSKPVMVASVFLLYRYLSEIQDLFYEFANKYSNIIKNRTRAANAEELEAEFTSETLTNHVLPPKWRELQINNLSFQYNGGGEHVHMDSVSFTVRRGEHIAFIGESGSGKSTCLRLMRDLYTPRELTLAVDGIEIPDGFPGIARAISLVPQDPEIFATTIRMNITIGQDHDDQTVARFTDMACFTHVVGRLPQGLGSNVNEKGVNLSGGEKQRLALSRGLLACLGHQIILLDEPTSSLDAATERQVYSNIFVGMPGLTIISTIHRLHLLSQFDRIFVFDRGKIVSTGTRKEIEACPVFQRLWQSYVDSPDSVE